MEIPEPAKERMTIYLPRPIKLAIMKDAGIKGQPMSVWIERALTDVLKEKSISV